MGCSASKESVNKPEEQKEQTFLSDQYFSYDQVKSAAKPRLLEDFASFSTFTSPQEEFGILNDITLTEEHESQLIPYTSYKRYNRYCDILPYERTAVSLKEIGGYAQTPYINANWVPNPFGGMSFIGTQGPIPESVGGFWRMIFQYRVGTIFMLCKVKENGRKKCEHYWPESATEEVSFDGLKIDLLEEEKRGEFLTKRRLRVSHGADTHELDQYHYSGWPDHGVPTEDALEAFEEVLNASVDLTLNEERKEEPVVYHCSAGIGRTGTLITLTHIMAKMRVDAAAGQELATQKVSVFETARLVREHRFYLIQTPVQYEFIYKYLQRFAKAL